MRQTKKPKSEWNHGRISTYANYGCRCNLCREACTAWTRANRLKRKKLLKRGPDGRMVTRAKNVTHGNPSTYLNWFCRCPDCTKAALGYVSQNKKDNKQKFRAEHKQMSSKLNKVRLTLKRNNAADDDLLSELHQVQKRLKELSEVRRG
jgi:hypothetical protein